MRRTLEALLQHTCCLTAHTCCALCPPRNGAVEALQTNLQQSTGLGFAVGGALEPQWGGCRVS